MSPLWTARRGGPSAESVIKPRRACVTCVARADEITSSLENKKKLADLWRLVLGTGPPWISMTLSMMFVDAERSRSVHELLAYERR